MRNHALSPIGVCAVWGLFLILPLWTGCEQPAAAFQEVGPETASAKVKWAGVRSSAYGIRPFPSPEGWAGAMKTMAGYFPDSTPFAIWIVGRLNGASGGTSLEFPRPDDGFEYGDLYAFAEEDKHEPYLKHFNEQGIKVFLQVEPGYADESRLIDVVLNRYKHHPSVIGWGIDVGVVSELQNRKPERHRHGRCGEGLGRPGEVAQTRLPAYGQALSHRQSPADLPG